MILEVTTMPKIRLSITIDAALLEELRARAQQDQRTLSNYINHVLKQHLAQKRQTSLSDRRPE